MSKQFIRHNAENTVSGGGGRKSTLRITVYKNGLFCLSKKLVEDMALVAGDKIEFFQDPEERENYYIWSPGKRGSGFTVYQPKSRYLTFSSSGMRKKIIDDLYEERDPGKTIVLLIGKEQPNPESKGLKMWPLLAKKII